MSAPPRGQQIQDPLLNSLRRERIPIAVYLLNGVKLLGTLESFDAFIILLRGTHNQRQMVYKHAISTIVPSRSVRFSTDRRSQMEQELAGGNSVDGRSDVVDEGDMEPEDDDQQDGNR